MERAATGRARVLGTTHPQTLESWGSLALLFGQAGRYEELPGLREQIAAGWEAVVAKRELRLGPDEPGMQFARGCAAPLFEGNHDTRRATALAERIIDD